MIQKLKISILGCGWLGLPLGEDLVIKGFEVKGSTTSPEKIPLFKKCGIDPYMVAITDSCVEGDVDLFLNGSETLIIDIPPKLRSQTDNFVGKIQALVPFIISSGIKNVLFVSSVSVYADDNSVITEMTVPLPETENGRQLLDVEKLLQQNPHFRTTALRFGGLFGGERHPVNYLAGRENLENPDAPVNLIHRNDCIGIIRKIIDTESWNATFNAASPEHPTRENYYTSKAASLGLPLPIFDHSKRSNGKTVDATKITETLGYTFSEPI